MLFAARFVFAFVCLLFCAPRFGTGGAHNTAPQTAFLERLFFARSATSNDGVEDGTATSLHWRTAALAAGSFLRKRSQISNNRKGATRECKASEEGVVDSVTRAVRSSLLEQRTLKMRPEQDGEHTTNDTLLSAFVQTYCGKLHGLVISPSRHYYSCSSSNNAALSLVVAACPSFFLLEATGRQEVAAPTAASHTLGNLLSLSSSSFSARDLSVLIVDCVHSFSPETFLTAHALNAAVLWNSSVGKEVRTEDARAAAAAERNYSAYVAAFAAAMPSLFGLELVFPPSRDRPFEKRSGLVDEFPRCCTERLRREAVPSLPRPKHPPTNSAGGGAGAGVWQRDTARQMVALLRASRCCAAFSRRSGASAGPFYTAIPVFSRDDGEEEEAERPQEQEQQTPLRLDRTRVFGFVADGSGEANNRDRIAGSTSSCLVAEQQKQTTLFEFVPDPFMHRELPLRDETHMKDTRGDSMRRRRRRRAPNAPPQWQKQRQKQHRRVLAPHRLHAHAELEKLHAWLQLLQREVRVAMRAGRESTAAAHDDSVCSPPLPFPSLPLLLLRSSALVRQHLRCILRHQGEKQRERRSEKDQQQQQQLRDFLSHSAVTMELSVLATMRGTVDLAALLLHNAIIVDVVSSSNGNDGRGGGGTAAPAPAAAIARLRQLAAALYSADDGQPQSPSWIDEFEQFAQSRRRGSSSEHELFLQVFSDVRRSSINNREERWDDGWQWEEEQAARGGAKDEQREDGELPEGESELVSQLAEFFARERSVLATTASSAAAATNLQLPFADSMIHFSTLLLHFSPWFANPPDSLSRRRRTADEQVKRAIVPEALPCYDDTVQSVILSSPSPKEGDGPHIGDIADSAAKDVRRALHALRKCLRSALRDQRKSITRHIQQNLKAYSLLSIDVGQRQEATSATAQPQQQQRRGGGKGGFAEQLDHGAFLFSLDVRHMSDAERLKVFSIAFGFVALELRVALHRFNASTMHFFLRKRSARQDDREHDSRNPINMEKRRLLLSTSRLGDVMLHMWMPYMHLRALSEAMMLMLRRSCVVAPTARETVSGGAATGGGGDALTNFSAPSCLWKLGLEEQGKKETDVCFEVLYDGVCNTLRAARQLVGRSLAGWSVVPSAASENEREEEDTEEEEGHHRSSSRKNDKDGAVVSYAELFGLFEQWIESDE